MSKNKNWKDALQGLGAKESPTKPSPTAATVGEVPEPQYAEPAPASLPDVPVADGLSADPASYPEWALRWAAAGVQLLGRPALVRGLYDAQEGSGRAADAFCRKVERALDGLPQARSQALRAEMEDLWGGKGVPTFCSRARTVMEAVQSGAIDAWLAEEREQASQAEGLSVPEPDEGEEIEAYRARLEQWAADQPAGILKRIGFDAWARAEAERTRREEARKAAEARKLADAVAAFVAGGSFDDLAAKLGSEYEAKHAVASTTRAWEMYRVGKSDYPTTPPAADWLLQQSEIAWLIEQAKPSFYGDGGFRGVFRARLIDLLPAKPGPGQVAVVERPRKGVSPEWFALTADKVIGSSYTGMETPKPGVYATEPHPAGWVRLPRLGEGNPVATYFPPAKYAAYATVHAHRGRGVDIRSWMSFYGRHPNKGFGRFRIGVVAGAAHRDYKTVSVDDRTAGYLDALAAYPRGYEPPAEAFRIPVRLVKHHDQGGHLVWDEAATKPGVAVAETASWVQMSRRSSGSTIDTRGGTAASWSTSSSTAKHTETAVFALILEGQQLLLDSGAAIVCRDGKAVKVPGGALKPGEKSGEE